MGTRADFYVGRGPKAEWIGSRCYDGHPESVAPQVIRGLDVQKRLANAVKALNNAAKIRPALAGGVSKISKQIDSLATSVACAVVEVEYRDDVARMIKALKRSDSGGILPADGWPWPWENSQTTDFAYAFDGGKVWVSCFGSEWADASNVPEEWPNERKSKKAAFPEFAIR
jgi:hypothetical protein